MVLNQGALIEQSWLTNRCAHPTIDRIKKTFLFLQKRILKAVGAEDDDLLVSKCIDGIQIGSLSGWIPPKKYSDRRRERKR